MKESIVLYPAPGSHQIISMVELAKLISQHHPNLPITILLTTSTPFETSTTSSSYINLISSDQNQTNPNLPISFFTLPSLHLHQSHIENLVESAIEFLRLNIPNVLQALETISQSSKVLAFITSSVHHPYDPQIPTYFYFTSCASALALFLYLPTIHNQTPKSFIDLTTPSSTSLDCHLSEPPKCPCLFSTTAALRTSTFSTSLLVFQNHREL